MKDERRRLHRRSLTASRPDITASRPDVTPLSGVRSGIVRVLEIIEDGRRWAEGSLPLDGIDEVASVLEDLERELTPQPPGVHCEQCRQWYAWPGLLDAHMYRAHWDMPANLAKAA
jgi:hypothetical protein